MTHSEPRGLKRLGRLDLCRSTQPAQVGVQIPSPSFTPSPISFGDLDFNQHASYSSHLGNHSSVCMKSKRPKVCSKAKARSGRLNSMLSSHRQTRTSAAPRPSQPSPSVSFPPARLVHSIHVLRGNRLRGFLHHPRSLWSQNRPKSEGPALGAGPSRVYLDLLGAYLISTALRR